MNDIESMQVSDSTQNLFKKSASLLLLNLVLLDDKVKKLAVLNIFHDQKQVTRCFDDLVELDDTRMPYELKNVNLSRNALHISNVDDFLFN